MTFSKIVFFAVLFFFASVFSIQPSFAQLAGTVGLLKADVTLADGTIAADVPVAIFKGTDRISTTKSSPQGKITTVLQPNATYRFVVSSNDYLYHEDTLHIGALKSYTEFPLHIVIAPLKDGQIFELPLPVFAPRTQDILPGAQPELERIVTQMKHNPKLAAGVTVYPDALPKNKKDISQKTLADARETSMRSYFLGKGISESRLSVSSNITSIPPGRFAPTDPAFPAVSATPAPTKSKKKKKSQAAPSAPGMVPQYVEIVAHLAN